MAILTVSTNGIARGRECHEVEDVESSVAYSGTSLGGGTRERVVTAVLTLTEDQALSIAYDLLYQAVDAGIITGWNVQHREEVKVPGPRFSERVSSGRETWKARGDAVA